MEVVRFACCLRRAGSYRTGKIGYFDRVLDIRLCRAHLAGHRKAGRKSLIPQRGFRSLLPPLAPPWHRGPSLSEGTRVVVPTGRVGDATASGLIRAFEVFDAPAGWSLGGSRQCTLTVRAGMPRNASCAKHNVSICVKNACSFPAITAGPQRNCLTKQQYLEWHGLCHCRPRASIQEAGCDSFILNWRLHLKRGVNEPLQP
jgi:hypothetical protein